MGEVPLRILYWLFVATLALTTGGVIKLLSGYHLNAPYCEKCGSFLDKLTNSKNFVVPVEDIMSLAKQGSSIVLAKMVCPEANTQESTRIHLRSCEGNCCAYLTIVGFEETSNQDSGKKELNSEVKLEGLLDERRTEVWREILPVDEAFEQYDNRGNISGDPSTSLISKWRNLDEGVKFCIILTLAITGFIVLGFAGALAYEGGQILIGMALHLAWFVAFGPWLYARFKEIYDIYF